MFFFSFRFLGSVLERHALIALAAVTLHDVVQLVRLSKPRRGAKYSLISYFFAGIRSLSQPCLGCIGAIGLVTGCGPTNTGTGRKGRRGRTFEGARDNLLNEQGVRQRRC
jgi:hypothetical protein